MDGFECIRQFKALPIYKNIPFICFTTSSSPEDRSKCKKLGAVEFITKPSNIASYKELLLASVQRWIPKPEVDALIDPLLPLPTHP
jgi:CheY-like chemotaxis protein